METKKIVDLESLNTISDTDLFVVANNDSDIPPLKFTFAQLKEAVIKQIPFTPKVIGTVRVTAFNSGLNISIVKTGIITGATRTDTGRFTITTNQTVSADKCICIGSGDLAFVGCDLPDTASSNNIKVVVADSVGTQNRKFQLVILQYAE